MMTSTQVVKTSVNVTTNSPSQDYTHPGDHTSTTYDMHLLTEWEGRTVLDQAELKVEFNYSPFNFSFGHKKMVL